jgi:3-deoxy-D-manno-octulosonate 8-phosphate phosphatase (KDO 8-P phosphatase)
MNVIQELFIRLGGRFISSAEEIREKYSKLKVVVFDWDGVFNNGFKHRESGSLFSETDSMGLNLLRFNFYASHGNLLNTFIVTGLNNVMAVTFAEREHFNGIYLNYKFKEEAFEEIRKLTGIGFGEMAFIFDDVLDFGMARKCGLSFFIPGKASPLTTNYVLDNQLCDYVTAHDGSSYAVREICELLIGLTGKFNETVEDRIRFKGPYEEYFQTRNRVKTEVFTRE